MRKWIVGVVAVLAVGCGGGGGSGSNMQPDPNPPIIPPPSDGSNPPPVVSRAPVLTFAGFRDTTIEQDGSARWVIDYDFEDSNGDVATIRVVYPGIDRSLFLDIRSEFAGQTSGSGSVGFDIPASDDPRDYSVDVFLEDATGARSNSRRINYTLEAGPVPASSVNVSGTYRLVFTSEFGGRMVDRYQLAQVRGTNRIAWTTECDDPGNTINCFHMDDAAGTMQASTDGGDSFRFEMEDGPCTRITGRIFFEGGRAARITGSKSETASSFCDSTPAFPTGTFTATRQ